VRRRSKPQFDVEIDDEPVRLTRLGRSSRYKLMRDVEVEVKVGSPALMAVEGNRESIAW
jgi:hypothetical protein